LRKKDDQNKPEFADRDSETIRETSSGHGSINCEAFAALAVMLNLFQHLFENQRASSL